VNSQRKKNAIKRRRKGVVKDIEGVGGSEGSNHGRKIRLAAIKGMGGYTRVWAD